MPPSGKNHSASFYDTPGGTVLGAVTPSRSARRRAAEIHWLRSREFYRLDLKDFACRQIDRPERPGDRGYAGNPDNPDCPQVTAVNEHRESEHQAVFFIDDQQPALPDSRDVAEISGVDLVAAVRALMAAVVVSAPVTRLANPEPPRFDS